MGTNIVPNITHYHIYNPSRDMANVFPSLAESIVARFCEDDCPIFIQEAFGKLDKKELAKALEVIRKLCEESYIREGKVHFVDVLRECGWEDLEPKCRAAVMAAVGFYSMMLYFKGIREIAKLDDPPPDSVKTMAEMIDAMAKEAERKVSLWSKVISSIYNLVDRLRRLFECHSLHP